MTSKLGDVGFNIVATHGDSPSFKLKPNAEIYENGYLKLNVYGYGGMINHTWLDRPLSLAGRVVVYDGEFIRSHIINIKRDLLFIPSQAIHINSDVNDVNKMNKQVDMIPVLSQSKDASIEKLITQALKEKGLSFDRIGNYDLHLYNRDKGKIIGLENEFIMSPRLDDLACVYPSVVSFMETSNENSITVFCAFNGEEIGSMNFGGADTNFLLNTLKRITDSKKIALETALSNSFLVSADNAHAVHPNASSKSDPTNKVIMNKGIAIKMHDNYTTNAMTATLFEDICKYAGVPLQTFVCRSDMRCGATLGGLSATHVDIKSVDVGIPQLSMHSLYETIGREDLYSIYKAMLEFFPTTYQEEKGKVRRIRYR